MALRRTVHAATERALAMRLVAREEAPATAEPTGREPGADVTGPPRSAEA